MKYFILFNLMNCLDLNLKVIKRPDVSLPNRNFNEIDMQGRNGKLVEDLGTYGDIKVSIELNFIEKPKFFYDEVRKIMFWLSKRDDYTLTLADDLEYYYKVKRLEYSDIERKLKVKGTFTLNFICEAFRYYRDNAIITITKNNYNFYSPNFAWDSEPVLKIYGSGNITLTINSNNILLNGVSSNIILDSVLKETYSNTYENLNNKMSGEFPVLINGVNTINWIGNITKIELVPNWRCL
ncbi:hypothetical protein JHL18_00535 [Clostridium sp. YIM B02505]|uniref:Phage tail protein n=1 Tax=Clostridium yunnanense TaxID=2800325 RepID=A0ABS1EIC2_9CLOT|nr:distal tail protein Dit [Clostridium yunnanense]MBK1809135.1 hypothetical protein [Clostridium yunnanense]